VRVGFSSIVKDVAGLVFKLDGVTVEAKVGKSEFREVEHGYKGERVL